MKYKSPPASALPADTIVFQGAAVKALGNGKVGGYLVMFGSSTLTDASPYKDYFTKDTDFGLDVTNKTQVLYHHGLDETLGNRKLGVGTVKVDDVGVWVEAQLELRDEYERKIYGMAEAKKLGWSSGTAEHLLRREKQFNGSNKITVWPLGLDASLTPTPAEPRTLAVPLKSLIGSSKVMTEGTDDTGGATVPEDTDAKEKRKEKADGTDLDKAKEKIKPGAAVKWAGYGSMPKGAGKVVSVHESGNVPGAENDVEATKDEPAANVHVHERTPGGGYKDTGRHLAHPIKCLKADTSYGAAKGIINAEMPVALTSVSRLHDMLHNAVCEAIGSEKYDKQETIERVESIVEEYGEALTALLSGVLEDEDEDEDMMEGMKTLLYKSRDRLLVNLTLDSHSDSVLTAVKGLATRFEGLAEIRAKQSRPLSADRLATIQELSDRLLALHSGARTAANSSTASPTEIRELEAALIEFEAASIGWEH